MDAGTSAERPKGRSIRTRCCIVGGGPAGMMLGYLLGRAGVETVVLEKHADFFRDFRGDTVHPSTLQVMDELGLIDGFLKLPHQQLQRMDGKFGATSIRVADLSRLKVKYPFIAFMARGLDAFRDDVIGMAPILMSGIAAVKTWDDVKLLTVAINRLKRWTRPGLLCIGDAAHAMSPVGGVGVNLAVQDAVATANLLADKLAGGCPSEYELDAVRRRREFPVRVTQAMQVVVQNRLISVALKPGDQPLRLPLFVRVVNAVPWLQGITARFVALGVRPEHVDSSVSAG